MKHLLSFSKMFETHINESRVHPKKPIETSGELLATNRCSYFYSHDDTATDYSLQRMARVYLDDKDNETLWMSIREEGTVSGPYQPPDSVQRDEILWFGKIGTLSKPDLQKVTGLLKPEGSTSAHSANHEGGYGYFKQRFASQFSPNGWRTPDSEEKGLLSDILKKYKSSSVPVSENPTEKSRDEMIEDIGTMVQKMSDDQLKQLLSKLGMTPSTSISKPRPVTTEGNKPEIVNYGEKAFAVFGDTREMKDSLSQLGGRFNRFLTNPKTQQREAGWIFPNSKRVAVEDILK